LVFGGGGGEGRVGLGFRVLGFKKIGKSFGRVNVWIHQKVSHQSFKNLESNLPFTPLFFAMNCFGSVSGNHPYEDVEIMAIIPSKI
jgi:hypothetical protein